MTNEEAIRILREYQYGGGDGMTHFGPHGFDLTAETVEHIISALERDRWISVKEALPGNDQDVLVMIHWNDYPEDMMVYGRRYKTRWYLWNGELGEIIKGFDITHWRPLPEPPKEDKP